MVPSGIRLNENGVFSYSSPKTTSAAGFHPYHHHNHDGGMMMMMMGADGGGGLLEMDEFTVPEDLSVILAIPDDLIKLLVRNQAFLRHQTETFKASDEEITTRTRGRNKQIKLDQVGNWSRHCAHLPVAMKQKGSMYFPATCTTTQYGSSSSSSSQSATKL